MTVVELRKYLENYSPDREVMFSEDGMTRASLDCVVKSGEEVLLLMQCESESNPQ